MILNHMVTAFFGNLKKVQTKPLYQYNYGAVLQLSGITLPEVFEVDFANVPDRGASKTQIGQGNQVTIPDEYLQTGHPVYAWIFVHDEETDGETIRAITIPVIQRAARTSEEPTPVQQDVITQAIAALNQAVERTGENVQTTERYAQDAINAASDAADSETNALSYAMRAEAAEQDASVSEQGARGHAEIAETAKDQAREYALDAEASAEHAEQCAANAGYMWINMDPHGHLIYTRTDAVDVDLDLDADGHLVMEAV